MLGISSDGLRHAPAPFRGGHLRAGLAWCPAERLGAKQATRGAGLGPAARGVSVHPEGRVHSRRRGRSPARPETRRREPGSRAGIRARSRGPRGAGSRVSRAAVCGGTTPPGPGRVRPDSNAGAASWKLGGKSRKVTGHPPPMPCALLVFWIPGPLLRRVSDVLSLDPSW